MGTASRSKKSIRNREKNNLSSSGFDKKTAVLVQGRGSLYLVQA